MVSVSDKAKTDLDNQMLTRGRWIIIEDNYWWHVVLAALCATCLLFQKTFWFISIQVSIGLI